MSSSTTTTTTTTATTRCAACRYLRRRCSEECVLAPYFPSTHPKRFAYVHRIFGASNVSRMIQQIPIHQRTQAADSISYEAYWRVRDPVYGSVGIISLLQQEICMKQHELAKTQGLIAMYASRPQGGHLAEPAGLDDAWQQGLLGWDQVTAVPGLPKPPPPPSDFM